MKKSNKTKLAIMIAATFTIGTAVQAVEINQSKNTITFDSLDNHDYVLKVLSPQKEIHSFKVNGDSFSLSANSLGAKSFSNGQYKFELTPITASSQLAQEVRDLNDVNTTKEYQNAFKATSETISGVFSVENNSLVQQTQEAMLKDQIINDDLIVTGSTCVGFDCVNGENFGFDTIRLKENNVRIKFDDTSNSGSFPNNDWQLTANDSANGGANKFSIDDITGGRTPFTIEASAPSNSLYVDDGGRLGLGTATPVVDIHSKSGNTPTLRLEQDGSSGFTAQTWDVAGNEANFFIRDVTNGSKLPFKIKPSAPTSSIFVAADGDIGLGTESPESPLHIVESGAVNVTLNDTAFSGGAKWQIGLAGNNTIKISDVNTSGVQFRFTNDGNFIMNPVDNLPTTNVSQGAMYTDSSGALCWHDGSSYVKVAGSGTCN